MGASTQRWWVSEERLEARLADEHQRFEREKQRDAAVRALIKRHDEITHLAGRIELAQRWFAEGRIDSEEYVKILEAPPNEPLGLKWVGYRFIDNNFEEKDMASLRDVTMTLEEFRARFRREPEAPGPDEHCCICNRKMPRVLGQDPTRFRHDGEPVLLVNDAGWMKVFFPWKWPDAATTLPEHSNVCPPCAERVAGYIAHLKKPALDDNDL